MSWKKNKKLHKVNYVTVFKQILGYLIKLFIYNRNIKSFRPSMFWKTFVGLLFWSYG